MKSGTLRIGELAKRSGLTVSALHHYDDIGLLSPSLHTEAGYRLYTAADVARLQRVLSLRQIGFSLDEIRDCLDSPGFAPLEVIQLHLTRLREQMRLQQRLCDRLAGIAAKFQAAVEVSADEFLQTIEEITMLENYFTPAQHDWMSSRREEAGDEALREAQEEWAELIAEVRAAMDAGTDPKDSKVLALAKRWESMVDKTTGGDPEITQALKRLWDEQGDVLAAQHGSRYDPRPVFGYIGTAIEAAKAK
jgi:MerR family transcriptional regulator, thiopeptide resistance regulator